jgi:hypothetical protein
MTREGRLSRTTGLLAALAVLLGVYVYLVEVRGGARREQAKAAATHLLPFPSETATELVIERAGERLVCRKEGGRWRLTAPVRTEADEATVSRLLEDVTAAAIERTVEAEPRDLAAFGLTRPTVLTIAAGPRRQSIEIGKENPTGSFVFARQRPEPGSKTAPTAPVLLVERRLLNAAEKTLYDLREKTVLDFSPEDVGGITFTHGSRKTRLERDRGGETEGKGEGSEAGSPPPSTSGGPPAGWRLVEPLRARADRSHVDRSLNLLTYLRAEKFVSEKPERLEQYGLAPPWGSVRFDLRGGRSEALLFGRKTEAGALSRYYARRPGSGPIFTINDNLPREARQPPGEWRERHVTDFVGADVAELRLISPHRTIVCAKREKEGATEGPEEWGLAEFAGKVSEGMNLAAAARLPAAWLADRDRVEDLLSRLGMLEAKAFLDGSGPGEPRFGLRTPELKIVAIGLAGQTLASVALGARLGDSRYATSPHLGGVFLVPASDGDRFRVGSRDLATRS